MSVSLLHFDGVKTFYYPDVNRYLILTTVSKLPIKVYELAMNISATQ